MPSVKRRTPGSGGHGSLRPDAAPIVNPAESPLAWLRQRRDKSGEAMISQEQFDAGERLRADFWFAQMTPRTTSNWDAGMGVATGRRGAPGAGVELQDHVVAAQQRVHRALAAVGPELSGILIDVCCHLIGLEVAERRAAWPRRAGKEILKLALTRLARHYGIMPADAGAAVRRPVQIRHWGAEDYRPVADVGE